MTSQRQEQEVVDKSIGYKETDTETNAATEKKIRYLFFILCTHCEGACRSLHDKEWSLFRLMACLQCSTKSAQMLHAEKMTLLTSSVSFLSTGGTPGPYYYPDTPTEPYHADENLTPLNLIKVFPVSCSNQLPTPLQGCPFILHREAKDDFISHLKGIP